MKISPKFEDVKPSDKIWRYMDLTKFLDLILNKTIYLRRIDKFEDPYEGYISEAYKANLESQYRIMQNEHGVDEGESLSLQSAHIYALNVFPKYAYANCWFLGDVESAAMWKLYGGGHNCVAISSSIYSLQEVLYEADDDEQGVMHLQKIRYVDEASRFTGSNFLNPMFEKRSSFSHEKEFRALYLLNKGLKVLNTPSNLHQPKIEEIDNDDGISLEIDVLKLISAVHISPTADPHFYSIVEKTLELAGLDGIECIQSKLYKLK